MPEAYILVCGQVYSSAYFIQRGLVQLTWAAMERDTVNTMTVEDYFGELNLLVTKKLTYTARSITHLDAFRLDRDDFVLVMRSHPAGAMHVADVLGSELPPKMAQQVTNEIYEFSGLRALQLQVISLMRPQGWRPARGLAEKLRKFAAENEHVLARIRARVTDAAKSSSGGQSGGGSGSLTAATAELVTDLWRTHAQLEHRVEANHERLEQKLEQICQLIKTRAAARPAQ